MHSFLLGLQLSSSLKYLLWVSVTPALLARPSRATGGPLSPLTEGRQNPLPFLSPSLLCFPGLAPGSSTNIYGLIGSPFIWFLGMHTKFVDKTVRDMYQHRASMPVLFSRI